MFNRNLFKLLVVTCCLIVFSAGFSFAQIKRNSRPMDGETNKITKDDSQKSVYFYEFSKPEFLVSKVLIEHNENGEGKITFQKKDYDEDFVEPIKLSDKSLDILKRLWSELNFLDSDDTYQSKERDYAHLGTMKLKMKKDQKERITEFNWTENLNAKSLADEYRNIGNLYVWMFDMNVSRENQPLESPRLMKRFDSYLKRNEISDPKHIMPFLKEISEDERIPLITRNHATRLIKQIEKIKDNEPK